MKSALLAALFLLGLCGCQEKERPSAPAAPAPPPGCAACHTEIRLDRSHAFACTDCHQGSSAANDKATAHQGLIPSPAEPARMEAVCGRCHPGQAETCAGAAHLTLKNEVNLIRGQFGLAPVSGLSAIPGRSAPPQDKEQLVDDLLRRRCLRCHLHTQGDDYPSVRRGTGCAACHLRHADGKLRDHAFILPEEAQCLSCHSGNRVGGDFFGSCEHDYSAEYRTPYLPAARPYGVEQHALVPDIHQQRGLTCRDCHRSGGRSPVRCLDCHAPGGRPPLENVQTEDGQPVLTGVKDGRRHRIPALRHPAHAQYGDKADCQVCHAQWAFNDQGTHLLLSYSANTGPWERLAVQSSSEAEAFIREGGGRSPSMSDSLTGLSVPGIWHQGWTQRRWEQVPVALDKDGVLRVVRPILDLRLSAADQDGRVIAGLDNIAGSGSGLLPYTPHTTGPAGLFYEQRFLHLLKDKQ